MGEATIVDEFITDSTAGPSTAQKGLIAIEPLVANLAVPGLNPQQHRLPIPAAFSDAHSGWSIAKRSAEIQARSRGIAARPWRARPRNSCPSPSRQSS
jgi:hypothetical protein